METNKQTELPLNFGTCIFDHFIIPKNDNWMWELKALKEKREKQYEVIKAILEKHEINNLI